MVEMMFLDTDDPDIPTRRARWYEWLVIEYILAFH